MENLVSHWNKAFEAPLESLGWYEADPQPAWDLVQNYADKQASIHLAGAGRSILVHKLWEAGFHNLLLSDLSSKALDLLKKDNPEIPTTFFWQTDLSRLWEAQDAEKFDLWLDRAVLHFLTKEEQRLNYFSNLKNSLKPQGRVILGQFALDGAKKCCGLDIYPYDTELYQAYLGSDFKLLEELPYTYFNPKGDPRPYAYAVFEKS